MPLQLVLEQIHERIVGRNLFDMGLTPGTEIKVVGRAPLGDPIQLKVRGYALTIRKEDAAGIQIREPEGSEAPEALDGADDSSDHGRNAWLHDHNAHPGLGEGGKYHSKDHENALPKGTKLVFALAGQQNCGTVLKAPASHRSRASICGHI